MNYYRSSPNFPIFQSNWWSPATTTTAISTTTARTKVPWPAAATSRWAARRSGQATTTLGANPSRRRADSCCVAVLTILDTFPWPVSTSGNRRHEPPSHPSRRTCDRGLRRNHTLLYSLVPFSSCLSTCFSIVDCVKPKAGANCSHVTASTTCRGVCGIASSVCSPLSIVPANPYKSAASYARNIGLVM